MKKLTITLLLIIFSVIMSITSCWNYREVDKLAIAAGIAIDKGLDNQYEMTVEIIKISGGKDTKKSSYLVTAQGRTLFETARNLISITGSRIYWSHTKVIILSINIASEGMSSVLDWYTRDIETREDVSILISKEKTAKEILNNNISDDILSFTLSEILENQKNLEKSPVTDILKYDIDSKTKGISSIIPSIELVETVNKKEPQIVGTS